MLSQVVAPVIFVLSCGGLQDLHIVDGGRWLRLSGQEQVALLDGYIDYYRAEVDPTRFRSATDGYAAALRRSLSETPGSQSVTLDKLLARAAGAVPEVRQPPGSEHYEGKHGYYNLDYWASALKSDGLRTRFIEGYLAGHAADPERRGRYSRPADWYAGQITMELQRRRDWNVAIGDLLEALQDKIGDTEYVSMCARDSAG